MPASEKGKLLNRRKAAALGLFLLSWPWLWLDAPWAPLWPSTVALLWVWLTQKVVLSLFIGGITGCILLANGNPLAAAEILWSDLFLPIWSNPWKLGAMTFTLILGGMASLIEGSGGLRVLLQKLMANSRGRASTRLQWGAFAIGIVCFFDGLANSMLVGRLMRKPADSVGLSRVKLAYIVDSTSSAVACLAIVSTWIAYQLAMIREGYAQLGLEVDAYKLFLHSIPYNFYCWFTLLLLGFVIWRNFNLGPMRAYEAEAAVKEPNPKTRRIENHGNIFYAFVPLLVLIGSLLVGLYISGSNECFPITFTKVSVAFGAADAASVLVISSILASITAFVLFPKSVSPRRRFRHFTSGSAALARPTTVLIGAWILGGAMEPLGTAKLIGSWMTGEFPLWLIPAIVFMVGAVISFTTGTSWGTMGILMPLAIPVLLSMTNEDPGQLMPMIVAAVFSGAVFGDHCSPISDTTLVSSISTGIDPADHVRTQMPYALIAAGLAVLIGFLPASLGVHSSMCFAAGIILLFMVTRHGKLSPPE